ncbi:MAG: YkgJ family cysteine cluster protein [Victivallales bacterium]
MIQTDLTKIRYYGKKNETSNWEFRSFLKCLDMDEAELDSIVHEINKEVVDKIDCKSCANCCKEMSPIVLGDEILRISERLGVSKDEFIRKYLKQDEEDENEFIINRKPCPFLTDNQCEIYDDRPEDCRSYPHLHEKGFRSRLFGIVQNYSICPIVFNVYEKLKDKFIV